MDQKQREEIMAKMTCPKDFECYKDGFEKLCSAKWQGNYTDCLEAGACLYKAGVLFGSGNICQCELRKYAARHLRK